MRDLNYRNKFKDGDIAIYQSVRALEKLVNSVFNGKSGPAREAFDEIKEDLMHGFKETPEEFFTKLNNPTSMAGTLQVIALMTRPPTPTTRAWALTAQAYLHKLPALC